MATNTVTPNCSVAVSWLIQKQSNTAIDTLFQDGLRVLRFSHVQADEVPTVDMQTRTLALAHTHELSVCGRELSQPLAHQRRVP